MGQRYRRLSICSASTCHAYCYSWQLLFQNPIMHPTVMWRREVVSSSIGRYNPTFSYSEDYDFWVRVSSRLRIEALPYCLVKMRKHENSITSTKADIQDPQAAELTSRQLRRYYPAQYLEGEALKDLGVIARRNMNLRKSFLELDYSRLRSASFQYIALFNKFIEVNAIEINDPNLNSLHTEIEQTLADLVARCRKSGWLLLAISLLLNYIYSHPYRGFALWKRFLDKLKVSINYHFGREATQKHSQGHL